MASTSSYDPIAGMYHRLWSDWYLPAAMPALERLFFSQMEAGAAVLDLCCGSGHVTRELIARGYNITGVDASQKLIEHARGQLGGARFLVQDARAIEFQAEFDGVLSTFDSLNHILSLDGLEQVFRGVRRALRPGALFLFDMNLEEAYSADLNNWAVTVDNANVTLVRGAYNRGSHIGATELIWFQKDTGSENTWRQQRSIVEERCYPEADIVSALENAGFRIIEVISAIDAGMTAQLGFGRWFFSAR